MVLNGNTCECATGYILSGSTCVIDCSSIDHCLNCTVVNASHADCTSCSAGYDPTDVTNSSTGVTQKICVASCGTGII